MAKMPVEFLRSRFQIKPFDEETVSKKTRVSNDRKGKALREIEILKEKFALDKEINP